MTALLYYVSGHGFGHAVRSAEVMRALLAKAPDLRLLVRTDAPAWLFPPQVDYRPLAVDVGLVQRDSLAHDELATVQQLRAYLAALPALAEREAELGRQVGARTVVGDIPPLAFEVAARLEVPGLALANFSWDGIYRSLEPRLPAFGPLVERVQAAYARATCLLRLPFHLPMPAFRNVADVPLVARRATSSRDQTRARLGLDPQRPLVLLSFGGYDLHGLDVQALASLPGYTFLITPLRPHASLPGNVLQLDRQQANYTDLVAASNVVVTKPGYGIVADCLAHRVPVLYTERFDFPEYPVLAEALEQFGRAVRIPQDDLHRGHLGPYLEALLAQQHAWPPLRLDGAQVVSHRVLEHLAAHSTRGYS